MLYVRRGVTTLRRKIATVVFAFFLTVTFVSGQATELDEEPGFFSPDSPLYGLDIALDNAAMSVGLKTAGDVAQERAAEARAMQEKANYAAAEKAAREMGNVAQRATEKDADGLRKARAVIVDIHANAPEAARGGLKTALENVQQATGTDTASGATAWDTVNVSCGGQFIDTHTHFHSIRDSMIADATEDSSGLDESEYAARMREHNISCVVPFVSAAKFDTRFDAVGEQLSEKNVGYLPFLSNVGTSPGASMVEELKRVHEKRKNVIVGIGEITFEHDGMGSLSLEEFSELFEYAGKQDVPVMFHPTQTQAAELDEILSRYPDTTFIIHGGKMLQVHDQLVQLMGEHENLYWQMDVATMLRGPHYVGDADKYVAMYDREADQLPEKLPSHVKELYRKSQEEHLQIMHDQLLPLMEAAPNRVMWALDAATTMDTDPEVFDRYMDFSHRMLQMLPEKHRDNYAYKNAQRLYKDGLRFKAPEGYVPIAERGKNDEGIGDLCSSLSDCMTYCATHKQECVSYCMSHPGNEICQTMQEDDRGGTGSDDGATGGSVDGTSGDSTTSSGLGDLCSSMTECMNYCQSNMRECINYCNTDPQNTVCQQLSGRSPGSRSSSDAESIDLSNPPKFVEHMVVPTEKITKISKIRGSYGHDYSHGTGEECRSMKHYIWFKDPSPRDHGDPSWYNLSYYAPADGTLKDVRYTDTEYGEEAQFTIQSKEYPNIFFGFFHVRLKDGLEAGSTVEAGEYIGKVNSDGEIATEIRNPDSIGLVSFFKVMTDEAFQEFKERGVESRNDFVIPKEVRDAEPLECKDDEAGTFIGRKNVDESLESFHEWTTGPDNFVMLEE